ncbi:DUF2953 domain-containing protein [Bacillus thuringiensis]|uniref:DUF2953 domain-containing protein n=1 Tax=Bacillus thuringiensis TaxID=1428 RepID=UPI00382DC224
MIKVHWFAIITGVILLLIVFIILSTITLRFTFLYTELEKQALLQVEIWMIRYTFNILKRVEKLEKNIEKKVKKAEEEGGIENKVLAELDTIGELIIKLREMHNIFKDFLNKVKINQWRWQSQIGTGDAASTGIVTGFAWSIKGIIVGVAEQYMHIINVPELEITPVFQGKGFASKCELTVSISIYWLIRAVIKFGRKKSADRSFYKNHEFEAKSEKF